MPEFPDTDQLADVFQLGTPVGPVERMGTGWGGNNVLWRLTTTSGHWAIKQFRRDPGPDVNAALAIELAAWAGGVQMPRPVPTSAGACFASVKGGRYRCHKWVDGVPLPWHGNSAETAAAVGEVLAKVHQLALPWSRTLLPQLPGASGTHWIALAKAARQATCVWAQRPADCLPVIRQLELVVTRSWRADGFIGSHRDLHPTNLLRLQTGALALVDWDAAGPVIPDHEVACFALVFGESPDREQYDCFGRRTAQVGHRHLEQARIRFLHTVFERQRIGANNVLETTALE
jgi:Ser/Thr protein kinase RdoA (MazF antagonist)